MCYSLLNKWVVDPSLSNTTNGKSCDSALLKSTSVLALDIHDCCSLLADTASYSLLIFTYWLNDSWHVFPQDFRCSTQPQGFVQSGSYNESDRAHARMFSALVFKLLTRVPREYFVLLGYTRHDLLWRVQTRRIPPLFLQHSYFIFNNSPAFVYIPILRLYSKNSYVIF